jgi:membrane-associated protease RseP (regulator of RpoE activity)
MNLLPVWPLDGGQMSRDALEGVSPRDGTIWALSVSIGVAALLAVHSFMADRGQYIIPFLRFGGIWMALMFALLAYQSFQLLQQVQAERRFRDDHWR